MVNLTSFLTSLLSLSSVQLPSPPNRFDNDLSVNINYRPVIGVLSQDISRSIEDIYPDKYHIIAASYVKFLESSGARVVPIFINQTQEYYDEMFESINGLLFPGGGVSIYGLSQYSIVGKMMFEKALEANQQGDYFPIWGTCLGFELLVLLANQDRRYLSDCYSKYVGLPLIYQNDFSKSIMGQSMPQDVINVLGSSNVTVNMHRYCLTPENFTHFEMDNFWYSLSTSIDEYGLEFISLVEAKHYPFWGSQFHPEKNAFEWLAKLPDKDIHSRKAVYSNSWFSEFFVEKARQSPHRFPDVETLERHLIYNFNPTYTGNREIDYAFQQTYLFDN